MAIPVGLVARLIRDHIHLGTMNRAGTQHEAEQANAHARELWSACTGPSGCLLILANNIWNATEVDHIRLEAARDLAVEPGDSSLGSAPHGLIGVCAGRHVVTTNLAGERFGTGFVLYPGEAFILRLDREAKTWGRFDLSEERGILERLHPRDLVLVHYAEAVASRRLHDDGLQSAAGAMQACLTNLQTACEAILAGNDREADYRVKLASSALVGAPILSFQPITSFIGFQVFELNRNRPRQARALLSAGLSILPDDPTLLAVLGELQFAAGEKEDAARNLERALARESGLDERLRARARSLLGA